MKIYIKLKEILEERNMTQAQLYEEMQKIYDKEAIRPATISEIANNHRTSINKTHLEKIAKTLGITKIQDLIDFKEEK